MKQTILLREVIRQVDLRMLMTMTWARCKQTKPR